MAPRPTSVRPLKLPQAPFRYDKGDIDRTRRLIEQLFNEYGLGGIQELSNQVIALEARIAELENPTSDTPPVPGFTFWFDGFQEAMGAIATWTNRAPDAPPASDLILASGDASIAASINGHQAVTTAVEGDFNNSDAYTPTGLFPTDEYTAFALIDQGFIDWTGAGAFGGGRLWPMRPFNTGFDTFGIMEYVVGANTEPDGEFGVTSGQPGTGMHVMSIVVTGGSWTMYVDGVSVGSGAGPWLDEAFWDVRVTADAILSIGEILVYPSALSGPDRTATEAYLTAKWS